MTKIALALIIKNDSEADELERLLSTTYKHVDAIYVTSTQKPYKRIKKVCKKYSANWNWFKWVKDFSKARNYSFSQVSKDYDWILWADADDILVGGENLHRVAEEADKANCKSVFARYLYQVETDDEGKIKEILIEHLRERLVKNDGSHKWVGPIHETLIEQHPTNKTDTQSFYLVHLTDWESMANAMYRNIEILQDEVTRNPQDPRPIYYLAKAYFDTKIPEILYEPLGNGMDSVTVELLKDYIRKSGWREERAQAWEYMSMIHRERQEFKKAIQCLLESFAEYPMSPSIYIQLALNYVMLKDWTFAMHWVKMAGQVDIPKTTLVVNPKDYKTMILECLYHIYLNTGKLEETENVAASLVELLPSDLNKERYREIADLRHRNNLAHWTVKLANHLKKTNQRQKLSALINSIPQEIQNEPVLANLRSELYPPRVHNDNEISIWCGPGFEKWSPKNVAQGIGGSEEAVIYLTRELAKEGWNVTVYGDPREDEGKYDDVNFKPYYTINWEDTFNVFVSWRQIHVFDMPLKAKKTYLWCHDIQNPTEYTAERMAKINKVMFLSEWHKKNVPGLPEDKIMITANGLNI